eukprot:jgi/Picsp_1/6063/NSC_03417-R1_protein
MKDHWNLIIIGEKVVLVPYRKEHVLQYHEWMKDEELLNATASEPLSLEEEYAMQEEWRVDPTKCTFIVLDKQIEDTPGTGNHGGGMVGDVNLFWNDHDDPNCAEIEVMVARKSSQRKGLATEALRLFMAYAVQHLFVSRFRAKILETNSASQQLFSKLGFKEVSRSEIFKEIVYEYMPSNIDSNSSTVHIQLEVSENKQEGKSYGNLMLQFGSYDANDNTDHDTYVVHEV